MQSDLFLFPKKENFTAFLPPQSGGREIFMKAKKWIALFAALSLLLSALYAGINIAVDPFGVFGDRLLDFYEYDMTMNPRVAKLAYLEKNHDKYDSYIIGCSKTSSYPVEYLNKYFDASFFNAFAYGGDMADEEKIAKYIIENYSPKNIVVAMSPEAAYTYDVEEDSLKDNLHCKFDGSFSVPFYVKYAFLHPSYSFNKLKAYKNRGFLPNSDTVFNSESGAYNKIVRDSIPIGSIDDYLKYESSQFEITHARRLEYIDECTESVARIKEMCDKHGVSFTLIASPMYSAEQKCYSEEDMKKLMISLAEVTDYYDFWGYNTVSEDIRYFYDGYHFRNCVGKMALAYIFNDSETYFPGNFGHLTTAENVSEHAYSVLNKANAGIEKESANVPILMYHHITPEPSEGVSVSIAKFEEQIKALSDAGYTAVSYECLMSFVDSGEPLPDKPIVITFDDGYESNISLAAPILEKYGMCATIAIVGVTEGCTTYKDTGSGITPHFSLDDPRVAELDKKGIIDIETHTYDMHQVEEYDGEGCRMGAVMLENESEEEFIKALTDDLQSANNRIKSATGKDTVVYTYPYGFYSSLSEEVIHSLGIRVSVTTEYGTNEIIKGVEQSLYLLKRISVSEDVTGENLVSTITSLSDNK